MRVHRLAALALLIALPSCGGDSPSQPQQPAPAPQLPAQLTVTLVQTQATASAGNLELGVQTQTQHVGIDITATNGPGFTFASISSISTTVGTSDGGIHLDNFTPAPPDNRVDGGASRTFSRDIPIDINTGSGIDIINATTTVTFDSLGATSTSSAGIDLNNSLTMLPPRVCTRDQTTGCALPSSVANSAGRIEFSAVSISSGGGPGAPGIMLNQYPDGADIRLPDADLFVQFTDNCATNGRVGINILSTSSASFTFTAIDTVRNSSITLTSPPGQPGPIFFNDPAFMLACPPP